MIELSGADLARLELQLTVEGKKEPVKYEFKGTNGSIVGGIALPKTGRAEYAITAFDAKGKVTHTGTGSIPGLAYHARPLILPLPPTDSGETLAVSLTRERLVLDVKRSDVPNDITVHVQAFDPRGNPLQLDPNDPRWGVTNPGAYGLIPIPLPDRFGVHLVPNQGQKLPPVKLCDLMTEVSVCLPNGHCLTVHVCVDPWATVSSGGDHTCALTKGGVAYCWGSNDQGQLGAQTTAACGGNPASNAKCSARPLTVQCPTGAPCRFTQISAGQTLTAAVDSNGDAWWWGRGAPDHHKVNAVLAGSVVKFSLIAAGYGHACALSQARSEIWCWGANGYGEAGAPKTTPDVPDTAPVRVMVPLSFVKIVAGGEHTCAIGTGSTDLVCWGRNDQSQSSGTNFTQGPQTNTGPYYFQQFGGLVSYVDVTASATSSCASVGPGNGVRCWGQHSILNVAPFGTPDHITAGLGQLCALSNQQASCMGSNNWGELGIGSVTYQTAPVAVNTPPAQYSVLSAGDSHTCGITPSGDAYCWGRNLSGQLGNGTTSYSIKVPTKVVTP